MQARARLIVIVGGGFSGTVLAANLLRRPPAGATRIVIVERQARLGAGVAYASHSSVYLLNAPAAGMSALADDAADLIQFAQRQLPEAGAQSYLPRHLYGDYLRELLRSAERAAPGRIELERVYGEAVAVHPRRSSGRLIVSVGSQELLADQVVLACGDPAPPPRPYAADVAGHSAYVNDPYRDGCIQPSDRTVLLIGTGLTMADVAVAAAERSAGVRIVALSRHGLLPAAQREVVTAVLPVWLDLHSRLLRGSLRRRVRAVRSLAQTVQLRGGDWREVINRVREVAPALWQSLGEADRHRFLRHLRIYWDIHRHRMAPATTQRVAQLRRNGQLQICAGTLRQLRASGDRIVALWRARGRWDTQELSVDRIVECSGTDHRLERTADKLWQQLLRSGLATSDLSGLGVRTGRDGALIGANGQSATRLFYLGPMLRAAHWEATAVGELRVRARELAATLAATLAAAEQIDAPPIVQTTR